MTAVYYIHPETLSVNIRDYYQKYDTALKNLKTDVENFVKTTKNVDVTTYINKKIELLNSTTTDGYYLKMSNKYPNRVSVYQKTSRDVGYVFSNITTEVKKILVFGLLDLSSAPDGLTFDTNTNTNNVSKIVSPKIEMVYLEELKEKIKSRKID